MVNLNPKSWQPVQITLRCVVMVTRMCPQNRDYKVISPENYFSRNMMFIYINYMSYTALRKLHRLGYAHTCTHAYTNECTGGQVQGTVKARKHTIYKLQNYFTNRTKKDRTFLIHIGNTLTCQNKAVSQGYTENVKIMSKNNAYHTNLEASRY